MRHACEFWIDDFTQILDLIVGCPVVNFKEHTDMDIDS